MAPPGATPPRSRRTSRSCRRCTAIYLELTEVNSSLAGIIAPLLLGAAATAYLGTALGGLASAAGIAATGKGAVLLLLDRARDVALANVPATAAGRRGCRRRRRGRHRHLARLARRRGAERPRTGRHRAGQARSSGTGPADRAQRDRSPRPGPQRDAGPTASYVAPPAGGSGASPAGTPTGAPEPTSPGPTQPSSPPPTQPPTPPSLRPDHAPGPPTPAPGPDLAVSAEASAMPGGVYRVTVAVRGFERDATGTLSVAGDGVAATLTLDDRCLGLSVDPAPARRTVRRPSRSRALAPLPTGASLTFTLAPDGGPADADPSDNRVVVPLG